MRQSPKASTDVDTIDDCIFFGLELYLVKSEKDIKYETFPNNPPA